jgi:hypothetical protein
MSPSATPAAASAPSRCAVDTAMDVFEYGFAATNAPTHVTADPAAMVVDCGVPNRPPLLRAIESDDAAAVAPSYVCAKEMPPTANTGSSVCVTAMYLKSPSVLLSGAFA